MSLDLQHQFSSLSTPLIADACIKLAAGLRLAPANLISIPAHAKIAGRALPAQHTGSVDVFLEAYESALPGDVLVVDNQGRLDEACAGDLTILEAKGAGLAGVIVWGLVRDTPELRQIGFPVFAYGTFPCGPRRLDPPAPDRLRIGQFGECRVSQGDAVFADSDGAVFVGFADVQRVLTAAQEIAQKERFQANTIRSGKSLRSQLRFQEYLAKRTDDPGYSLRKHLRVIGGAIEE
jgi:4-hydroxy-4-methyl-2-oxoglutarate aldolase